MKLHRATPELWPPSLNKTVPTQNARGHFRLDYWREVPLTKVSIFNHHTVQLLVNLVIISLERCLAYQIAITLKAVSR